MASVPPTLADLRKAGTINSGEIVAAIDAYIRDPAAGPYRFASGHSLDIAATVGSSSAVAVAAANPGRKEKTLRTAVTAVIMTARPTAP